MIDETYSIGTLIIIKGLDFGGVSGGSDKFGYELCLALNRMGYTAALCVYNIFNTDMERTAIKVLESENIPIFVFKGKSAFKKLFNSNIHGFCKQHGLSIAHSHFQVGSLLACILKFRNSVSKIIRTAHITQEWGKGLIPWLFRQIFTNNFFPKWFDAEIGVSLDILRQLESYKKAKKHGSRTGVIYNGIPEYWFDQKSYKVKYSDQNKNRIIGAVGLLVPRKGFDYLIKSMPKIIEKIPDCNLIIIGDGPQRSELENIVENLNIHNFVSFKGQQRDIRYWLNNMDLLVLPSLAEGFPTILLESMATKVPVIATDIKGSRELVIEGQTGWLVPISSPDAIADKIIYAFSHPDQQRMIIEKAYNWAKNFTIENAAKEYIRLHKELIFGGIEVGS
jgi:glycosyltransferase involved in cell wall biosynthesis